MHGWHDYDVWRQRREDIAREVRTNRMGSASRKKFRPARDLKWELSRYGELLGKFVRRLG